jgi:hypothetical protein
MTFLGTVPWSLENSIIFNLRQSVDSGVIVSHLDMSWLPNMGLFDTLYDELRESPSGSSSEECEASIKLSTSGEHYCEVSTSPNAKGSCPPVMRMEPKACNPQ